MRHFTVLLFAAGGLLVLLLEGLALASWQGWLPRRHVHLSHALPAVPAPKTADANPETVATPLDDAPAERAVDAYYRELRAQLRWTPVRMGGRELLTMDLPSRMLLAKSAARHARLHEVGLG